MLATARQHELVSDDEDDCFARHGVAELMIESATCRWLFLALVLGRTGYAAVSDRAEARSGSSARVRFLSGAW